MTTIGFLGAGSIGGNMALRLIDSGHELFVCDINPQVQKAFGDKGVRTTGKPRDLAATDIVLVMVADEKQLEQALFGDEGLVQGDGTPSALVVMSTLLPGTIRDLPKRLGSKVARVIDAPVSGGLPRAREGSLAVMAGGTEADFLFIKPVLQCLGSEVFHCGELGAGAVAKLLNNLLGVSNLYLAAEAYALAQALGADLSKILPILDAGSGRNFTSKSFAEAVRQYAAMSAPAETFFSLVNICTKDLKMVQALKQDVGVSLPVLGGLEQGLHCLQDRTVAERVLDQWRGIGRAKPRA